jgi:hypothetical protein
LRESAVQLSSVLVTKPVPFQYCAVMVIGSAPVPGPEAF